MTITVILLMAILAVVTIIGKSMCAYLSLISDKLDNIESNTCDIESNTFGKKGES